METHPDQNRQDGQLDQVPFEELSIAVLDLETSGLSATAEIIEIAIFHIERGFSRLAFQSLVRPERRIGNRELHGISNRDVRRAPRLVELKGEIVDALTNRVLVSHNVPFDLRFLLPVIADSGHAGLVPTLCTLEFSRAVLGQTLDLSGAAEALSVDVAHPRHRAASDASTTARVLLALFELCRSAEQPHLSAVDEACGSGLCRGLKRHVALDPRRTYERFLKHALEDSSGPMPDVGMETRAAAHSRALYEALGELLRSDSFGREQREKLANLVTRLRELGWAPGD